MPLIGLIYVVCNEKGINVDRDQRKATPLTVAALTEKWNKRRLQRDQRCEERKAVALTWA